MTKARPVKHFYVLSTRNERLKLYMQDRQGVHREKYIQRCLLQQKVPHRILRNAGDKRGAGNTAVGRLIVAAGVRVLAVAGLA